VSDFGSGHDPRFLGLSPELGSAGSLLPSLCPSTPLMLALFLSHSLKKKKKKLSKNK